MRGPDTYGGGVSAPRVLDVKQQQQPQKVGEGAFARPVPSSSPSIYIRSPYGLYAQRARHALMLSEKERGSERNPFFFVHHTERARAVALCGPWVSAWNRERDDGVVPREYYIHTYTCMHEKFA